jgi:hypothetical protein
MPGKLFDIPSPPSNAIVLDKNRKGIVQYTVTNISGRPLRRAAARPVPNPGGDSSGLPRPNDGVASYTVSDGDRIQLFDIHVNAPPNAQNGKTGINYP